LTANSRTALGAQERLATLAVGVPFMMWTKMVLWVCEKRKTKTFSHYLLHREKIWQRKKFNLGFIYFQSHQMPCLMHSLIWCFVWRDGAEPGADPASKVRGAI